MTGDDGELSSVRRSGKSEAAFRTISEVSEDLDVPQHVLRFWEGKFPQVRPLKRGGGRRYYRPDDVALLRRIRDLLYSEGYTIRGVQKLLKEGGAAAVRGAGAAGAEVDHEPELGLPLDIHDPDPPVGGEDGETEGEEATEIGAAGTGVVAVEGRGTSLPSASALAPETRRELEDLLDELEQLRILLQPR